MARDAKTKCRYCESASAHRELVSYQQLRWVQCTKCGTGSLSPYHSELDSAINDVEEVYRGYSDTVDIFDAIAAEKVAWILSYWDANTTVVEVGPGLGRVASALCSLEQVEYIAIEPNLMFAEKLRERGLSVYSHPIESFEEIFCKIRSGGRVPLVFMDNVLEHISDPLNYLRHLNQFLGEEARLLIEVPNEAGLNWRHRIQDFLRGYKKPPTFPGHINLFTQPSLHRLLRHVPFNSVEVNFHGIRRLEQVQYLTQNREISARTQMVLKFLNAAPVDRWLGLSYWLRAVVLK